MSVYTTPEDICNAALVRLGHTRLIGNILEGSPESTAALQVYSETREAKLREFDWGFAELSAPLALLKTAPVGGYTPPLQWSNIYPILPWIYEYTYPAHCVKLRSLRGTPILIPQYAPQAVEFRIAHDPSGGGKVILTNLANAIAVITGNTTDPTLWDADFTEALIADLQKLFEPQFGKLEMRKEDAQAEAVATQTAEMRLG